MDTDKIERCGFCGRYFIGNEIIPEEIMSILTEKQLNIIPLGYCPDAHYEDPNYREPRQVTRDMAIDAGQPELEGTWIN
jgi:hypothetical protein